MRVAICDDEFIHRETLKSILDECKSKPEDAEVFEYSDGKSLVDEHKRTPHDILFLDIEMEGMTGLETGHDIRSIDRNVIIIYVTSHGKYVFKSFRIEPFDYILKPIEIKKIEDVLRRAVAKYREQHHSLVIAFKEQTYTLKVCDIVYLESNLRHIKFYTDNNTFMCLGKLDEYERNLTPYGFLRCHQSFLLNMGFIRSINRDTITTTNSLEINMSTRKKQECLNAFNEYITKYKV
jgi:DNA-binding LytR/AlgR family response regulator